MRFCLNLRQVSHLRPLPLRSLRQNVKNFRHDTHFFFFLDCVWFFEEFFLRLFVAVTEMRGGTREARGLSFPGLEEARAIVKIASFCGPRIILERHHKNRRHRKVTRSLTHSQRGLSCAFTLRLSARTNPHHAQLPQAIPFWQRWRGRAGVAEGTAAGNSLKPSVQHERKGRNAGERRKRRRRQERRGGQRR